MPGIAAAEPTAAPLAITAARYCFSSLVTISAGVASGLLLAQPVDVGLDRGALYSGAALDDLRQRLGRGAWVLVGPW